MGSLLSKVIRLEKVARFFFNFHNIVQIYFIVFCMSHKHQNMKYIVPLNISVFTKNR